MRLSLHACWPRRPRRTPRRSSSPRPERPPSRCFSGEDGETVHSDPAGGIGGISSDPTGRGDGGGGGGGYRGGGGGAAGSYCLDGSLGTSGAGGGAGSSTVPTGGQFAVDTTGQPSVTISYEQSPPTVAITVPADGATYGQGAHVRASYRCSAGNVALLIASCSATVTPGNNVDTTTLGDHTFTATAVDRAGLTAASSVH